MNKSILILGASSNLGIELSKLLIEKGYEVYGSYNSTKINLSGLKLFKLDFRSDTSISDGLKKINTPISLVINCCGITVSGPFNNATSAQYLSLLDLNVVGAFRIMKELAHVLPPDSRVINITSLNGVLSLPNYALYSSSKFALEALSFGVRHELKSKGIQVSTIALGAFKNESKKPGLTTVVPARVKYPFIGQLLPIPTAYSVAEEIIKISLKPNLPARSLIGRDTKLVFIMLKLLPYSFIDKILSIIWQKK